MLWAFTLCIDESETFEANSVKDLKVREKLKKGGSRK
jgi:hypothetical protein